MAEPEQDQELDLEIGDTLHILGGQFDKTQGVLYGYTAERFTLMPTGVSDRVIHIPLVDGAPDPDLDLEEILVLRKAAKPGFVHLLDLRGGQYVETFASGGIPSTRYTVKEVNEARDSAVLADEAGDEEEIVFGFRGIPRDLPFEVMRTRDAPLPAALPAAPAEAPVSPLVVDDQDLGDAIPDDALVQGAEPAAAAPVTYELGDTVDIQLDEEIKEISTANRFYPDVFQRSEMLSQLIRLLPESQQRNPVKLQGVRRMVERMMHLRNQAVEYGLAGEPRGERATSASTLSDLLSHGTPALGRAVVNMKKVFYMSHANPPEADPEDAYVDNENLVGVYLSDVIKSDETMQEDYASKGEGLPSSVAGSVPTFYTHMESLRKLNSPYSMTIGAIKSVPADKEVFRLEPPGGEGVPSYQHMHQNPETTAPYSLVRTLKERTAGGAREPRQVEVAETPELVSTLLFPRSTQVELGPIRSGFLGLDISRSITPRFLLSEWIDTLGDATDFPTADGLLLLGLNGIVGNVGVKEWLEAQSFPLNSVAEAHTLFSAYGFSQLEWNTEQAAVLQNKVDATLAGIRVFLARTREEAAAGVKETVAAGLLTEARSADLLARVESEPLLQKAIETLRRGLGSAANVDIIWFSALAVTAPDLLLAVLGQQPAPLVRERLRLILKQRTVANENGYKLRLKLASAGEPPFENPCEHTAALEKVRRVSGADGTKLLAKFLGHYRSRTEDNWVFCNVCDSHLLCGHELLLIQQFVRPKEREALYKEMLLTFSAGTEGRSYICRECGQSLKEIEYDTNLEFDDEGRPMMGRSVMVDKDAIAEQEIEDLLADPATTKQDSADQEEQYTSDENKRIHRVLKRIAGLLGVAPDAADYKRIMEEVTGYIVTLLTRDAYIAETRGKKAPDYDIYRSLRIVSAAAAAMLLDIQTHIPEYKVYFTSADCVGGFGGWPLVITDAPLAGAGITCVSTVVAGINDDEEPWNQTTLQRQPNLLKRREALEKYVKGQVDMFLKSPAVQAALVRKREYLEEIGKSATGTKTRDQLRSTFRPVPHKVSTKDAAKEPIAAGAATPRKAAEAWIRSAHGLAAAAGAAVKGCCFKSLSAPAEAWTGLPALAERVEARRSDVRAVTTFEAGIAKPLDAKTDPAAYWRLFSRLCWRGESKGRPHQLGIGLTCGECGLNFIENPSLTAAAEVIGQEQAAKLSTQLIQHMETQGVVIDEDTFLDLLDTAHRVQKTVASVVPPPPRFEFPTGVGPLDGWPILLTEVQTALSELGPTATTLQVATAAEKLVRAIAEKELFIRERIGAEAFARLETLTTKTARECGNAVMTGFVVPFQRWLTSVNQSSFKVLDSYELSPETVADILVKGMGVHLRPLGETSSLTGLARAKAAGFVAEVSEYCRSIFPVLRASLTPGGSVMVVYLLRAYVMGSVARLLDPHDVPGGAAAAAAEAAEGEEEGVGLRGLQRAFLTCLTRYSTGSRIPTEDEIRLDLEKRAEAEKQKFIKRLDGMTREQRRVDLAEKAIGIGVWAIGGSKKLRTYDADRYEEERNERALAGLTDYADTDAAAAALDSGYDNEQQKEDDY